MDLPPPRNPAPPARRRLHLVMTALVVLACGYFAVKGWSKAVRPRGSDFTIYYEAAARVVEGGDPFDVEGYLYPPFSALCVAPLTWLPYGLAAALWQAATLAAVLWSAHRARRLVERAVGRELPGLAWAPLLLLLRVVDSNLSNGQMNPLVFAAVLEGLVAWSRGRELRAGTWLGLAAALKVLPALYLGHLLLRGRWRGCLTGTAVALLCAGLLPCAALGVTGHGASLERWWQEVAGPYRRGGEELLAERDYAQGQGLQAVAYRYLTTMPATNEGADGVQVRVARLDPEKVQLGVELVHALLLLLVAATVLRNGRAPTPRAWLAETCAVACLALLLAPVLHKAHVVWLLPCVGLALVGARERLDPGRAAGVAGIAVIALTTPLLVGRSATTWLMAHGALCGGLVLLLAFSLTEARKQRP